ncbi:MAG TPA: HD domain-containing protein, partial [Clostridia bacterium]|nr:HD domain-containing protein [Clostridia bacterium]
VVASCVKIFGKYQLDSFCIETALSIKEFILNDLAENSDFTEEPDDQLSVSVAVLKDGKFVEIFNEGSIKDCDYDLLAEKYTTRKQKGIYFGGSYIVFPLFIEFKLTAIIYFEGIGKGVSDNLKNIVMIAYSNISIALDNLKLKSDIVKTQYSVFSYLAEMAEAKSEETGLHLKRVSEYVRVICQEMGMGEKETEIVSNASMMHDIGKLAIPDELIRKKTDLTPAEFNTLKRHVIYGGNMLSKSSGQFMEAAAVIALQHHERWNGGGYLGLRRDQIHPYARIAAVADVYDALTSKRSYKESWTEDEAAGFILEKSGTDFDPEVTAAFIRCIDKINKIKNENLTQGKGIIYESHR